MNRNNYYQEGWLATGNIRGVVGVTFTSSHARRPHELPLRTNYNLRGHRSDVSTFLPLPLAARIYSLLDFSLLPQTQLLSVLGTLHLGSLCGSGSDVVDLTFHLPMPLWCPLIIIVSLIYLVSKLGSYW